MKHLTVLLTLIVGLAVPVVAEDQPTRSLETSVYGSWALSDDFGGLGGAPGVGVTYGYRVAAQSQLGVTLVRFSPWLASRQLYQVSYGLEYKHFWSPSWGDLGAFTPWMSYSLLLDQTVRQGVEGRGLAHHTRLALGSDWAFADQQRLFVEAGWSQANYASFGVAKAPSLMALHAGLGWKWLF